VAFIARATEAVNTDYVSMRNSGKKKSTSRTKKYDLEDD